MKNQKNHHQIYPEIYEQERDSCGIGLIVHVKGKKSHQVIKNALTLLKNLEHRGAEGYDPLSGDGAGILLQISKSFFIKKFKEKGIDLLKAKEKDLAIGMIFFPSDIHLQDKIKNRMTRISALEGMKVLGWREVEVVHHHLGDEAKKSMPHIFQVALDLSFKLDLENADNIDNELRLYILRKKCEKAIYEDDLISPHDFSISSLSAQTIVYKGMLLPNKLALFYPDLCDPSYESAIALVHSRFSTNTFPAWRLAHPFQMICHNGEINTIQGNRHWMKAREKNTNSLHFQNCRDSIFPVIRSGASDSSSFDEVLQFLVGGGYSLPHALMLMVPEPWGTHSRIDESKRNFYEYSSPFMEPWDGPAAIAFSDGKLAGALLDRNGLRPCRYQITSDDLVILASEAGALEYPLDKILAKGKLGPGKMLLVDTVLGKIIFDPEIKNEICKKYPYGDWLLKNRIPLNQDYEKSFCLLKHSLKEHSNKSVKDLLAVQKACGFTEEEWNKVLFPMFKDGHEAISSMGNDTPLAILSLSSQVLFKYFRQLFAQVTNPPIDPLREQLVMSLRMDLGRRPALFSESEKGALRISIRHPILTPENLFEIEDIGKKNIAFKTKTLSFLFKASDGILGFKACLEKLKMESSQAIKEGVTILILSDRGLNQEYCAIPSLLAQGLVHHHLIKEGLRPLASLIVESAEPRDVHHFACLLGYGANAICPYLMFHVIENYHLDLALKNYIRSIKKGLLKIFSKMGISTLQSYQGAQVFEIIGLSEEVVDQYFKGTSSRISGMGILEMAKETIDRHQKAFNHNDNDNDHLSLDLGGDIHFRPKGEIHQWNPETIVKLQQATRTNNFKTFKEFSDLINNQNKAGATLRGLLDFNYLNSPIPISEVEAASSIVKSFTTGAMSLGSLSKEAHETLAQAMNKIGGKSNSGEGGEDPNRYFSNDQNESINSAIKQVASARFGVTAHYLVNAKELQIKVAQGAKPGEGGQIPGHKVDQEIARVRYSTPGVQLISPPPHHDIYSIEDLAQLIFDLKNVNPKADVSVKLVSELGVGTIASGVAKARADKILISGDSGGTGASPISSIKYAGAPWELGLADAHQTLIAQGLRGRVRLETDGQLKTGRDVVIAALLGAEEFGFATAPLVVEGCVMMRKCHLNTCPVGVATQDINLRKKFKGQADHVINYFFFVAEEVREIMALLGVRTLKELVGRSEFLKTEIPIHHWKAQGLNLNKLLHRPSPPIAINSSLLGKTENQHHAILDVLDLEWIKKSQAAIFDNQKITILDQVKNTHRSLGAMLSGEIARIKGAEGLPHDAIEIFLKGTAGQSFGAFLAKGISLELAGEANDYVGKGLSGGKIIIYPPPDGLFSPSDSIIIGNTALYGATSGMAFFYGLSGERFAVRNSGAIAVIEGVGDHGCEYMTGGAVVILGPTGKNFAAGMSGGLAFVYNPDQSFERFCNLDMVDLLPMNSASVDSDEKDNEKDDLQFLLNLIKNYWEKTKSQKAALILSDWQNSLKDFTKVVPKDYKRVAKIKIDSPELPIALTNFKGGDIHA